MSLSYRLKGPELFDYLSEKDYLEEKEARMYIRQLLEAIAYCHERKIIHLDLKVSLQSCMQSCSQVLQC